MDIKNEKLCFANNKFSFYYKDDVTLFITEKTGCLLKQGREIKLNSNKYIVEVKNGTNTD